MSPTSMSKPMAAKQLSDMEIADRVNQIISGGKMRRRKIVWIQLFVNFQIINIVWIQ